MGKHYMPKPLWETSSHCNPFDGVGAIAEYQDTLTLIFERAVPMQRTFSVHPSP